MCLTVEVIPNKLIMAMPVVKELRVSVDSYGSFSCYTPYRNVEVDKRILFATGRKSLVRRGSDLESGFIHSWRYGSGFSSNNEVPLAAYALGVEAFGNYDVASIAVYIPKFDNRSQVEVKELHKLFRKKNLTFAELLVEFPELAVAKKRFKALEAKYQK